MVLLVYLNSSMENSGIKLILGILPNSPYWQMFAIYIYIYHIPTSYQSVIGNVHSIEMNNTETFIVVLIYYSLLEEGWFRMEIIHLRFEGLIFQDKSNEHII